MLSYWPGSYQTVNLTCAACQQRITLPRTISTKGCQHFSGMPKSKKGWYRTCRTFTRRQARLAHPLTASFCLLDSQPSHNQQRISCRFRCRRAFHWVTSLTLAWCRPICVMFWIWQLSSHSCFFDLACSKVLARKFWRPWTSPPSSRSIQWSSRTGCVSILPSWIPCLICSIPSKVQLKIKSKLPKDNYVLQKWSWDVDRILMTPIICKTTFLKNMIQPCLYGVSKDCGKRRWRAYSAWTCPSWCKWFQRTSWIRKTKTGEPRNRPLFEHILTCVFRFDVFLCSYNMRVQGTRLPPPNSRAEIRRKPQLHQNTMERNALFAPSGAGGLIVSCLFAFF